VAGPALVLASRTRYSCRKSCPLTVFGTIAAATRVLVSEHVCICYMPPSRRKWVMACAESMPQSTQALLQAHLHVHHACDNRSAQAHHTPAAAPQVFPSAVNMADTYYWYTYLRQPSDRIMTDFILDQYEELYRLYCRDRGLVPPGRLLELRFRDLDEDPIAVLQRVYDAFGWVHQMHLMVQCCTAAL
jgi:hypothetical protein